MTAPATSPVPALTVRGGIGGIEARYDDMVALARIFATAGQRAGDAAAATASALADGAGTGALLDPLGATEAEWALGAALAGPHGVVAVAAECGAGALGLRAAAAAYLEADRLGDLASPLFDALAHSPAVDPIGLAETLARARSPLAVAQAAITSDPNAPGLVVDLLGGAGGVTVASMSAVVHDGQPVVVDAGVDPAETTAPHSVSELIAALARRDGGRHGEIDIRFVSQPGGHRSVIVLLPGTKSLDPLPNGDATSPATDLRAVRGAESSYARGVVAAMRAAGVRRDDPVLLVGHSEGGLVALNVATQATASGEFDVRQVITAGAPIGLIAARVPASVQVLALEDRADVVPDLDGLRNPDRVNVVTATFDRQLGTIGADHDLRGAYLPGARAVDASPDASVRAFLAGSATFLHGAAAQTHVYVIQRAP